ANCYNCHSADHKAAGGLRVDDHKGILQGGGRGPGVVPGDVEKSVLIQAVRQTDSKLKMPPEFKLTDEQIAVLEKWIAEGAVWPALEVPQDLGKWHADYEKLRQEHWSWQPLATPSLPVVRQEAWVRDDLDRFILAGLEKAGLPPVADADKLSLLRRVTFDLTGLPPSPKELEAFLADESPETFASVVDRLLASTAYGERWGRHWLDVARYGESTGSARNLPYPHAWRYRDWVVDAFNADKPYDRFLQEQLAGDLLPAATPDERDANQIATGFLAIGVKDVNQRFKVRYIMDNIDEQIDTVSRSVLGLTVSCARCHDHKFDPIPTTDYYALAGIFHSTDLCAGLRNKMGGGGLDYYDPSLLLKLQSPSQKTNDEQVAKAQAALEVAKDEFERLRDSKEGKELAPNGRPKQQQARQRMNRLQAELTALTDPAVQGVVAMGVRDAKAVGDTEVRLRGEAEKLGPVVPRGYLTAVSVPNALPLNSQQSGRLELAQWLTSPQNPLTPRVAVNRVWHHLFGQGIVSTVDNFGVTGAKPSHPELLDHLATRFMKDGWSVKRLVRSMVLSHAYQLSATTTPTHLETDPSNRLVWRHSPRRLHAEEIRDATLAAAGTLDRTRPSGSAAQSLKVIEMRNNGPEAKQILEAVKASPRRSVYLPLVRTLVPPSLEVFDFADQGLVTGSRDTTTVPTQALYLLNDPLVRRQALALAEQLFSRNDLDETSRLQEAYLRILNRPATSSEIERARFYLSEYAALAGSLQAEQFAKAAISTSPADALAAIVAVKPKASANATNNTQVVNPDDVDQTENVVAEDVIQAKDPQTAAWASYLQALLGTAEFRYLP
ncbi:MAG: PSD1 and planctomycete cytochrome C domain-containing protein, partial [Planctomycetaceae bacterium]|nr:PSD1 and planctomycete cytochrome C domain-containing protein [Planctomycetaceae bacterium]